MIKERTEVYSNITELVNSCNRILEGKTENGDLENLEKLANAICLIKDKDVNIHGLVKCGMSSPKFYNEKVKNKDRELTEEEWASLIEIFRQEPDDSVYYEPYLEGRYTGD